MIILMSFRRHYILQQGLHTPVVALSAAFFACTTKFAYCKVCDAKLRIWGCFSTPKYPLVYGLGRGQPLYKGQIAYPKCVFGSEVYCISVMKEIGYLKGYSVPQLNFCVLLS